MPTVARPKQNVWVETDRRGSGDERFWVRYSMARESITRRPAWSVSVIEKKTNRTIIVRVFYEAGAAREAWRDAKAGKWGQSFPMLRGAGSRAPERRRPEVWERALTVPAPKRALGSIRERQRRPHSDTNIHPVRGDVDII